MAIYRFGNANGEHLTVANGDITGNVITFGNGNDDYVLARDGNISQDTITFGHGHNDRVLAPNGNISDDVILFDKNSSDATVQAGGLKGGIMSNDTIVFGDGAHNRVVDTTGNLSNDEIVFGTGSHNSVESSSIIGTDITFHDLTAARSNSVTATDKISDSNIVFGDGNKDILRGLAVVSVFHGPTILSGDTIQLGNGDGDLVDGFASGGKNKIILGNGNNDIIALNVRQGLGGDYLATGTGAGDFIAVSNHTNSDTFAFATFSSSLQLFSASSLTKVYGAQSNDKVEVNGGALGNALVSEGALPASTTLSSFINAVVGDPTKGHTYIGNNGTTTFIETDTDGGQLGAVEIVGVFAHSTISNHVLTLLT